MRNCLVVISVFFSFLLFSQSSRNYLEDYNEAYFSVSQLNEGLPSPPPDINLQSPQAVIEHFLRAARDTNFTAAAYAMNFNLYPQDVQQDTAARLAEQLFYVLNKQISISWGDLPDRPDGQSNSASLGNRSIEGEPRRSIIFGRITLNNREIPLSVQRIRKEGNAPVWLVSSATVESIPAMYQAYGPTWVQQHIPAWGQHRLLGLPIWKLVGVFLLATCCYLFFLASRWLIRRLLLSLERSWLTALSEYLSTPVSIALATFGFYQGMNTVLSITGGLSPYLYAFLLVIVIGTLTWTVLRAIDYFMERLTKTQVGDISDEKNLESRRLLTNISIARRLITFIVILVGAGVIAGQFPALKNLGVSLLASAGLATLILGVAAQPVLGNVMAGLQIAITKPVRIGDSVLMEGEYGTVEDLRFTYLVVKTWDARRLIVPLRYFITHPFENWSMNDAQLFKPFILHARPGVDVDQLRTHFKKILAEHDLYDDSAEGSLQVVGGDKESIEIRCLCPARDPGKAWDLHCELREAMYNYLAKLDGGEQLARERVEIIN